MQKCMCVLHVCALRVKKRLDKWNYCQENNTEVGRLSQSSQFHGMWSWEKKLSGFTRWGESLELYQQGCDFIFPFLTFKQNRFSYDITVDSRRHEWFTHNGIQMVYNIYNWRQDLCEYCEHWFVSAQILWMPVVRVCLCSSNFWQYL